MLTEHQRKVRARLARAAADAKRTADPAALEAVATLRREFQYLSLQDHIKRVVDAAPPLTPEMAGKLRDLLPAPVADEVLRGEVA